MIYSFSEVWMAAADLKSCHKAIKIVSYSGLSYLLKKGSKGKPPLSRLQKL